MSGFSRTRHYPPLSMTLPGGTRLAPYEITGAIGAGVMGEVYRARDEFGAELVAHQRWFMAAALVKHPRLRATT